MRLWRATVPVLLALALLTAGSAAAQQRRKLSADLRMMVPQARSCAPTWVVVELECESPDLVEGHLELTVRDSGYVLGRVQSGELALTSGKQSFRLMLPHMTRYFYSDWAEAELIFVGEEHRFLLGRFPLSLPSGQQRQLVVCAPALDGGLDPAAASVARSLFLERLDPRKLQPGERDLFTSVAAPAPEDLPLSALGYCSFDVVVLAGEAFGAVGERKLRAVRAWAEAGGSVCVVPQGNLEQRHLDFLNALAGGPAFRFDARGRIVRDEDKTGVLCARCGVGRAVVVLQANVVKDSAQWRECIAFLWKLRRDQTVAVGQAGKWRPVKGPTNQYDGTLSYPGTPGQTKQPPKYHVYPIQSPVKMGESLMPKTVRVMPRGVILLIMFLFVVAVGPVDYILLGLIRQRRLTWLLFPLICIGFTVFVVLLSRHYMGRHDYTASFRVVDVGAGGKVLRESRVEMMFAARSKNLREEMHNCFFCAIDLRQMALDYTGMSARDVPSVRYEGWLPSGFTVSRTVPQWTPTFHRRFSLGASPGHEESPIALNWDAFGPSAGGLPAGRTGWTTPMLKELLDGKSFGGALFLLHGSRTDNVHSSGDVSYSLRDAYGREASIKTFLREISARPEVGFFGAVSQISPHGGRNFEDLSILDPSDPKQSVLVAVVKQGNDYVICRRLYCGGE